MEERAFPEDTMFQSLKRKLTPRERQRGSSAGSGSDLEDRVVMLCEDVPSESSCDSGHGSQGAGGLSGGDSPRLEQRKERGPREIGPSSSLEKSERRQYYEARTAERENGSNAGYYSVCSTLRIKELYDLQFLFGCLSGQGIKALRLS